MLVCKKVLIFLEEQCPERERQRERGQERESLRGAKCLVIHCLEKRTCFPDRFKDGNGSCFVVF